MECVICLEQDITENLIEKVDPAASSSREFIKSVSAFLFPESTLNESEAESNPNEELLKDILGRLCYTCIINLLDAHRYFVELTIASTKIRALRLKFIEELQCPGIDLDDEVGEVERDGKRIQQLMRTKLCKGLTSLTEDKGICNTRTQFKSGQKRKNPTPAYQSALTAASNGIDNDNLDGQSQAKNVKTSQPGADRVIKVSLERLKDSIPPVVDKIACQTGDIRVIRESKSSPAPMTTSTTSATNRKQRGQRSLTSTTSQASSPVQDFADLIIFDDKGNKSSRPNNKVRKSTNKSNSSATDILSKKNCHLSDLSAAKRMRRQNGIFFKNNLAKGRVLCEYCAMPIFVRDQVAYEEHLKRLHQDIFKSNSKKPKKSRWALKWGPLFNQSASPQDEVDNANVENENLNHNNEQEFRNDLAANVEVFIENGNVVDVKEESINYVVQHNYID